MGKENFDALEMATVESDPVMADLVKRLETTESELTRLREDTRFTQKQKESLIADLKKEHADISEKIAKVMMENAHTLTQETIAKAKEPELHTFEHEPKQRIGPNYKGE